MHTAVRPVQRLLPQPWGLLRGTVPAFLCPALARLHYPSPPRRNPSHARRAFVATSARRSAAAVGEAEQAPVIESPPEQVRALPLQCPGCGAPSQVVSPEDAGFYSLDRNVVQNYLRPEPPKTKKTDEAENRVLAEALKSADPEILKGLGMSPEVSLQPETPKSRKAPVCDRCHQLLHHHTGTPIVHPSIDSIKETIEESPYKRNHIYHVIDAADFPMSLVPQLQHALDLSPMRSRNRRAKDEKFQHGRVAEVSFIVTRADLLAPQKEQVDSLLPYVQSILKDIIERKDRKKYRLGNVHLVSAQRGWWTKNVKEAIWKRGGAGWMVGKANVGKSNLFEVVFPKGRGEEAKEQFKTLEERSEPKLEQPQDDLLRLPVTSKSSEEPVETENPGEKEEEEGFEDEFSLLPPAQKEVPYPDMPTVSDLPGTTAAPIRIPFGDGRGELIDLPGLHRSDIENYILPERRSDTIMKQRVVPEKIVMKDGKSILLGNLIRITPVTPDDVFIVHPFMTLKPHLTSTHKAIAIHNGDEKKNIDSVATEEAGPAMRSAGRVKLTWDVTRAFTGPLTRGDAGKIKPAQLPFVVLGTDILVEGIGWVEITAQVRKRRLEQSADPSDPIDAYPEVEIFSPEGRFVGERRCMKGSVLGGKKPIPKHKQKARPRLSMKSVKARRLPKKVLEQQSGTAGE